MEFCSSESSEELTTAGSRENPSSIASVGTLCSSIVRGSKK